MKDIDRSKIHVYAEVVELNWETVDGNLKSVHDIKMKKYLHQCTPEDFNRNDFERAAWKSMNALAKVLYYCLDETDDDVYL